MPEWNPPVECPNCNSTDTRFVESHEEMPVYECNRELEKGKDFDLEDT